MKQTNFVRTMLPVGVAVLSTFICLFLSPISANADTIVFSNNFEDGNFDPEVGTWTFAPTSALTQSVVGVGGTNNAGTSLGSNVGLIDQGTIPLDLTLNLTDTVSLANGNTVTLDFNVAARRTNGNSRTIFIDALDSSGDIVTRLVLGDAGAFGNGGNADRQRPGFDNDSTNADNTANSVFNAANLVSGNAPNSFFYGADTNPATFNTNVDAEFTLTIGASTFQLAGDGAFVGPFSSTAIDNYDGGTFADIASFEISSAGTNYGIYLDNIAINGVVAAVPEPSSLSLLGIAAIGFCGFRRRRS